MRVLRLATLLLLAVAAAVSSQQSINTTVYLYAKDLGLNLN